MPVDPTKRSGKGAFPIDTRDAVDEELIDNVVKQAQTRTVLFDYLHMLFVGFFSALAGLFQIKGTTSGSKNRERES